MGMSSLITHLQIFGIGFSFGIAGPCFFMCGPVILTYLTGNAGKGAETIKGAMVFLAGRLSAYMILGLLAGISAAALNKFLSPAFLLSVKALGGAMAIVFGLFLLSEAFSGHDETYDAQCSMRKESVKKGGLFFFGFTVGLTPCAPLSALLVEIALMSEGAADGAAYALSFGLGTFLSGLILIGAVSGLASRAVSLSLRSKRSIKYFKAICAILLISLGSALIWPLRYLLQ